MSKQSPLQQVKDKFGDKEKLVEALVGTLERLDGEGDDDFRARLLSVSNKKLLRLHRAQARVTELGGKEGLVEKIAGFKNGDADYKRKLMGQRITRLLDLHDGLARRA
jgi:hypothetical protein